MAPRGSLPSVRAPRRGDRGGSVRQLVDGEQHARLGSGTAQQVAGDGVTRAIRLDVLDVAHTK